MKRKLLFTALLLLALALPFMVCAETLSVENDRYILSLDADTLEISVTYKQGGQTITSSQDVSRSDANDSWKGFLQSSITLEVTEGTNLTAKRVDAFTAQPLTQTRRIENGFEVDLDFTEIGQRLTMRVMLGEDNIYCMVPGSSIEEYGETKLSGLYLLPFFGATERAEKEGYMFVPEASGAIIALSDGSKSINTPYRKRIYGGNIGTDRIIEQVKGAEERPSARQASQITYPVYGMAYTQEQYGFMAVIDEGAQSANILCYPAGATTEFNWIGAQFILREEFILQTTRTQGLRSRESNAYTRDMGIKLFLLDGVDATYAGMARRYRAYLESEAVLSTQACSDYRVRLDFLGAESEKWLLWNRMVAISSLAQINDALTLYESAGITAPYVLYKGWQGGGLSLNYGSGNIGIDSRLGTEAQLLELAARVTDAGGEFALEQEAVMANPARLYNMQSDIVRGINQTVAKANTNKTLFPTMYYFTPSRTAKLLNSYKERYAADVSAVALPTLSNTLYSYYSAGQYYTRGDTQNAYAQVLKDLEEMRLALHNPIEAYYAMTDVYLDLPLSITSSSFIEAEVPFLPIVLSNAIPYYSEYINFAPNRQTTLLKLIEYGANPSFILTGEDVTKLKHTNSSDVFVAQYNTMLQTVAAFNESLRTVRDRVDGARLYNHEIIRDGLVMVQYDNGITIVVNYQDTDAGYRGKVIPAQGYALFEEAK